MTYKLFGHLLGIGRDIDPTSSISSIQLRDFCKAFVSTYVPYSSFF
jgi:hypothetical protein